MFRVIKFRIIVMITLCFCLGGCLIIPLPKSTFPGYIVYISINKLAKTTLDNLQIFEQVAEIEKFGSKKVTSTKKMTCITYNKFLNPKVNEHLNRQESISMVYCYSVGPCTDNTEKAISDIEISIGNAWNGMDPEIQKEVDRISDMLYQKLQIVFGKDVTIQKIPTQPPF